MRLADVLRKLGFSLTALLILLAAIPVVVMAQTSEEALGAELYAENCAVCHGASGEGRIGANLSKNWPSIRPDLTIRNIILNGVPGTAMPAWSQAYGGPLSVEEVDAIVAYILSWQEGDFIIVTPAVQAATRASITPIPEIEGDPNRGALIFDENCVVCHGMDGEGRIGATLSKNWPGIRPDLAVKSTISNGIPNTNMPAWSQTRGGPLSETDIEDVTAFVLTLGQINPQVQATPTQLTPWAESNPNSFLRGWGGVFVFIFLFVGIIAVAIFFQERKPEADTSE